ncbi:flagellar hook-length control protein FliK [Celerinatantimonas yamalensis]|uniref:Flagellar hook-length control protein FliK n=1 Tax=Celerinatantimonas yamalensis TaxID=559956 RepID=A0ABW9G643_9GAMM
MATVNIANISQLAPSRNETTSVGVVTQPSHAHSFNDAFGQARQQQHWPTRKSGNILPSHASRVNSSRAESTQDRISQQTMNSAPLSRTDARSSSSTAQQNARPTKHSVTKLDTDYDEKKPVKDAQQLLNQVQQAQSVSTQVKDGDPKLSANMKLAQQVLATAQKLVASNKDQSNSEGLDVTPLELALLALQKVQHDAGVTDTQSTDPTDELHAALEALQQLSGKLSLASPPTDVNTQIAVAIKALQKNLNSDDQVGGGKAATEVKNLSDKLAAVLNTLQQSQNSKNQMGGKEAGTVSFDAHNLSEKLAAALKALQQSQSSSDQMDGKEASTVSFDAHNLSEKLAAALKALQQSQSSSDQMDGKEASTVSFDAHNLSEKLAAALNTLQQSQNASDQSNGDETGRASSEAKNLIDKLTAALKALHQDKVHAGDHEEQVSVDSLDLTTAALLVMAQLKLDQSVDKSQAASGSETAMAPSASKIMLSSQMQAALKQVMQSKEQTEHAKGDAKEAAGTSNNASTLLQQLQSGHKLAASQLPSSDPQDKSSLSASHESVKGATGEVAQGTDGTQGKKLTDQGKMLPTQLAQSTLQSGQNVQSSKPLDVTQAMQSANDTAASSQSVNTAANSSHSALQAAVHQAVKAGSASQHEEPSPSSATVTNLAAQAHHALSNDASGLGGQGQQQGSGQSNMMNHSAASANQKADSSFASQLSMNNNTHLSSELNERVNYMVSNKLQTAEIRLDPGHLGSMNIRLSLHHDQAQVQIQVHNPQARDMLEQTMPKLKEMLAQQGIQLGQSQISQQNSGGQGQAQQQAFAQTGGDGRGHLPAGMRSSTLGGDSEFDEIAAPVRHQRPSAKDGIDYYA